MLVARALWYSISSSFLANLATSQSSSMNAVPYWQ